MVLGRGDDTAGSPRRAQISQFELFELILFLKLDKQFPVEQFEATVSQSTVPSPLLRCRNGKPHKRFVCFDEKYNAIVWKTSKTSDILGLQSYMSKGIWRQGIGSFVRNSCVSTLCPVVICPYLCTSEACFRCPRSRTSVPGCTPPFSTRLGKGRMGSALMGSLQMSCFLTKGLFWVLLLI